MIAELLLIVELLKKSSFVGHGVSPSTAQPPTPKPQAVKHTEGSGATLGGFLDYTGKIEKITQPVVGVGLTPKEASEAYLQAGTGRPEKIGTGGRF